MSDTMTQDGTSRREGGRGNRRRRGGKNFRGNRGPRQEGGHQDGGGSRHSDEPSGFQKFLSTVTFGLLGKQGKTKIRPRADRPAIDRPASAQHGERPARQDRGDRPERGPRPPREAPPAGPVTTERLYIGNLSYDASESDLFELFAGVGQVRNAEVVVNSRTQRSKGFAFVTMASLEEAQRAVDELNGKEFMGRPLQVNGAKPPSHDRGERRRDEDESGDEEQSA